MILFDIHNFDTIFTAIAALITAILGWFAKSFHYKNTKTNLTVDTLSKMHTEILNLHNELVKIRRHSRKMEEDYEKRISDIEQNYKHKISIIVDNCDDEIKQLRKEYEQLKERLKDC